MKLISVFQKTPLLIAVEDENIQIVKLLLGNLNIDVNFHSIPNCFFTYYIFKIFFSLIKLQINCF